MKNNISDVIAVILNGTATDSEQIFFNNWIEKDELNQEIFETIKNYWQLNRRKLEIINEEEVKNRIWAKAHQSIQTKSKNLLPWVYRIAAAIALVITFTFLIREFSPAPNKDVDIIALKTIVKNNLAGVKSKIHLPDGSIINLNAESSIKFVEGFKDSIRWVELKGEAFFDVVKNQDKPFVVKSGDIITKALGTTFNVNAYPGNSIIEVSLVEGSVEVHSILGGNSNRKVFLEEGQYVSFKNNNVIDNGLFDYERVVSWKEGIITFENASYNTVISKLERWYGIKFEFAGKEPFWNLDAKFDNSSLEQILSVLSHSEGFEYQLLENTVKLKMK